MNESLWLWRKGSEEAICVYDITYDKNGYPLFLIHEGGQWKRASAKHFTPESPHEAWEEENDG